MKITKNQLKRIIKEELTKLNEYGSGYGTQTQSPDSYDYYEVGTPGDIGHNPEVQDYSTARLEASRYGLHLFGWIGRYKEGPLE